jgi:hypothetical protein
VVDLKKFSMKDDIASITEKQTQVLPEGKKSSNAIEI